MKAFSWASTSVFSRRGAIRTNSLSAAPPGQRRAYTSAPTLYSNSPTSCRTPCTRSCSLRATEPWIPCDGTRSHICSAGAGRSWAQDISRFACVHYWTKAKIQRLGFKTPIPAPLPGGGGALPPVGGNTSLRMINAPPTEGTLRALYQPRQSKLLLPPSAIAWWRDLSLDRSRRRPSGICSSVNFPAPLRH
jgi:hypothetical protein